jgi:hypothetical protein
MARWIGCNGARRRISRKEKERWEGLQEREREREREREIERENENRCSGRKEKIALYGSDQ